MRDPAQFRSTPRAISSRPGSGPGPARPRTQRVCGASGNTSSYARTAPAASGAGNCAPADCAGRCASKDHPLPGPLAAVREPGDGEGGGATGGHRAGDHRTRGHRPDGRRLTGGHRTRRHRPGRRQRVPVRAVADARDQRDEREQQQDGGRPPSRLPQFRHTSVTHRAREATRRTCGAQKGGPGFGHRLLAGVWPFRLPTATGPGTRKRRRPGSMIGSGPSGY